MSFILIENKAVNINSILWIECDEYTCTYAYQYVSRGNKILGEVTTIDKEEDLSSYQALKKLYDQSK